MGGVPGLALIRYFPGGPPGPPPPAGGTGERSGPAGGLLVDRDGVLNRRVVGGYVLEPSGLEPLDGLLPALRAATDAGVAIAVVSNQGAVSRGMLSAGRLQEVNDRLLRHLAARHVRVAAVYACPHHPAAPRVEDRVCACRKPQPGLLLAAAADLGLDLGRSVMVGDQESDRAAARAAGVPERNIWTVDAASMGPAQSARLADEVTAVLLPGRSRPSR